MCSIHAATSSVSMCLLYDFHFLNFSYSFYYPVLIFIKELWEIKSIHHPIEGYLRDVDRVERFQLSQQEHHIILFLYGNWLISSKYFMRDNNGSTEIRVHNYCCTNNSNQLTKECSKFLSLEMHEGRITMHSWFDNAQLTGNTFRLDIHSCEVLGCKNAIVA